MTAWFDFRDKPKSILDYYRELSRVPGLPSDTDMVGPPAAPLAQVLNSEQYGQGSAMPDAPPFQYAAENHAVSPLGPAEEPKGILDYYRELSTKADAAQDLRMNAAGNGPTLAPSRPDLQPQPPTMPTPPGMDDETFRRLLRPAPMTAEPAQDFGRDVAAASERSPLAAPPPAPTSPAGLGQEATFDERFGGPGPHQPNLSDWLTRRRERNWRRVPAADPSWMPPGLAPGAPGLQDYTPRRDPTLPPEQRRAKYQPVIDTAARWHKLDAGLLTRLIEKESTFDPNAVNRSGAEGIAQFMPATARGRKVDSRDPIASIFGAAEYVIDLRSQFKDNIGFAVAAYNWGPRNVEDWRAAGEDPAQMPKETRDYVQFVTGQPIEAFISRQSGKGRR